MNYLYTPEESQSIANALVKYMQGQGFTVDIEKPLHESAPCSTTLFAQKANLNILFEVQKQVHCDRYIKDLALWLLKQGFYAELFIATHNTTNFSGEFLKEIDHAGIGLIIIENEAKVEIVKPPVNPALKINPSPSLKFGSCKEMVKACIDKFGQPISFLSGNDTRKDALRDLCEIVEKLTEDVALAAIRKGYLQRDEDTIKKLKWADKINVISAKEAYATGCTPFVSEELKLDLHAFRNGRNIVDHKVRTKKEDALRQQKFPDRMITGIRLVSDLASIKSSIDRKKKITP
jgi:hypothetical protein